MVSNTKNISDGWQQTTVDKMLIRYFTGPSPTCEERNISNSEEWGVLKTTAVTWKGWNLSAHKTLPEKYWGLSNLEVHAGDVLITKAGPRHRCGVVVFVDHTIPHLIVSGKMVGLRPDTKKLLPLILSLALAQSKAQKYLDIRTTGMAESQLNFTNENLLKTPITIPPIPEQNVILNIWTSLDKAIKKTDQLIEKYKSIKQGLMQDLFRYGIDEKGLIRNEKTHKFKDSPIGRIPKEWNVLKVEDCCDVLDNKRIPLNEDIRSKIQGDIPYYGANGVQGYINSYIFNEELILIAEDGGNFEQFEERPIAYRITGKSWVNNHAHVLRTKKEFIQDFIFYSLEHKNILYFIKGGTRSKLNRSELDKILLSIPSQKSEQTKISSILNQADKIIKKEEIYKMKLLFLKQGLMQDLLTGKVRVNHLLS